MTSYVKKFVDKLNCPKWLPDNTMFEGITGSYAYGMSDDLSDMDIIGICIPPKDLIFPHLAGEIPGFGTQKQRFDIYLQHRIEILSENRTYDFSIYSIVKFFDLAMRNNPNILEMLYIPNNCVLHYTAIYSHLRHNRSLFLHKGAYHKHIGYCFSQLNKISKRSNSTNEKRADLIEKYGFDTKFAAHAVRLILQCEQILTTGEIVLNRDSGILKSIRRGEWELERIIEWVNKKERDLTEIYNTSNVVPYTPDEARIKKLLLECLEMHYEKLDDAVTIVPESISILNDLQEVIDRYRKNKK